MKGIRQILAFIATIALLAACSATGRAASSAGGLSPSSPVAADTSPPGAPAGPTLAPGQQTGDLLVWLSSTPAQPPIGAAQIKATLLTRDGKPVSDAKVTYDIDMTNMSHGLYQVQAQGAAPGHYAGQVHFLMGGPWRIITIIERPGQPPVRLRFEFRGKSE